MKHLFKQLSASSLEAVGYVRIGDNSFNLARKGSSVKGFLNGYEVYSISEKDPQIKSAGVVLASIMSHVFKDSGEDKLKLYKSEWKSQRNSSLNFLDEVVPNLNDSMDSAVVVVRNKPTEERDIGLKAAPGFSVGSCVPLEVLSKNLSVLKRKVSEVAVEIEESLDVAETFTRRKLKDSMWGAKGMQKILDDLRVEFLGNHWSPAEISIEILEKSVDKIIHKLNSDLIKHCDEEKKLVVGILVPNIIKSYENIKETVIRLVTLLAPLIVIDKTFTEKTSYPARFFIPDEIVEQTQDRFNSLVDFLCLAPTIESKVLDPLDFVRIQMLNEIKEP